MGFGESLGVLLRRLRESEHISQEKLARILDMSRETVRRIEHGEGTTTGTVQQYLDALGRTPADLLRFDPDRTTPDKRGRKERFMLAIAA
jgi:transcriptional regulator with XRE-family HTH domain